MKKVTLEMVETAKRLRAAGLTINFIAKTLRIDDSTVRVYLDPEYASRRRAEINASRRARYSERERSTLRRQIASGHLPAADAAAALATVPVDRRNWFSRFMGDPLPGRSALDRKMNKSAPVDNPLNLVVPAIQRDDIEDRHSNGGGQ